VNDKRLFLVDFHGLVTPIAHAALSNSSLDRFGVMNTNPSPVGAVPSISGATFKARLYNLR